MQIENEKLELRVNRGEFVDEDYRCFRSLATDQAESSRIASVKRTSGRILRDIPPRDI